MSATPPYVLLVEDSDDDVYAFRRAFRKLDAAPAIERCNSSEEAQEFMQLLLAGPPSGLPRMVFLDLNMPGAGGRAFLRWRERMPVLRRIPLVVYSTSSSDDDVRFCYENGANAYHQKPLGFDEMLSSLEEILHYWTRNARTALPA